MPRGKKASVGALNVSISSILAKNATAWLIFGRHGRPNVLSCSCSSSCSCSMCWASAAKRESPVMILFDRSEGETSPFSTRAGARVRARGITLFPTGSSYFKRPVSLQRRIRGVQLAGTSRASLLYGLDARSPVFRLKPASNLPLTAQRSKKLRRKRR